MKHVRTILAGGVLLVMLLVTAAPFAIAQGESAPQASKFNVMVTVRIGRLEGGKRVPVKSYSLVVADGTVGSKLLSGKRVPFPAAGDGSDGGARVVYQNIGFVSEMRAWIVDENTIKLVADIEDSSIEEGGGGGLQTVTTRQLSVNAILTDGVPLELTRLDAVTDISGYVEVEARILR